MSNLYYALLELPATVNRSTSPSADSFSADFNDILVNYKFVSDSIDLVEFLPSVRSGYLTNPSLKRSEMAAAGKVLEDDDDIVAMASLSLDTGLSGVAIANNRKATRKEKAKEGETTDTDSSDEEDGRKAPNQLIMEFLECVMSDDLENSLKLCKMILLYEPNNSKALAFLPLIQEKIEQDEAESEGEDDSSDEETDSDTDDSEEDSSGESGDEAPTLPNGHCDHL